MQISELRTPAVLVDETLEPFDPGVVRAGDVVGMDMGVERNGKA